MCNLHAVFVRPLIELRRLRKRETEKANFSATQKGEGDKKKEKGRGTRKYIYPGTKNVKCKKVGEGKVYEMMSFFFIIPPFLFREQNLN